MTLLAKRGLNFLIIHFLLTDPWRYHYFKRFISELMAANPHSKATLPTANTLLKSTFPNWQQLEIDFADFVNAAKPSFYIVNGPWEQVATRIGYAIAATTNCNDLILSQASVK